MLPPVCCTSSAVSYVSTTKLMENVDRSMPDLWMCRVAASVRWFYNVIWHSECRLSPSAISPACAEIRYAHVHLVCLAWSRSAQGSAGQPSCRQTQLRRPFQPTLDCSVPCCASFSWEWAPGIVGGCRLLGLVELVLEVGGGCPMVVWCLR